MGRPLALAAAAATLLSPAAAGATYSLLAADTETGQVGAAGASCVPYEVIRIYGVAPGQGAVVAQAYFDDPALAEAVERLGAGEDADAVLGAITDPAEHPLAPRMQWGVVDARGGVAHATGALAKPYADAREGGVLTFALSVQGNLLTSSRVLERAIEGFEEGGCDLAERLMLGLEAASAGGEGDGRCTPDGIPAKSAFLDVTGASGAVVHISVPDVSPDDPVTALRGSYDAWRVDHACPEAAPSPTPPEDDPDEETGSCATSPDGPRDPGLAAMAACFAAIALGRRRRH